MNKYGFISAQMEVLALPYEFMEWTSDIQYPYYVGEFTDEPITDESGREETTVIISGFHRGKFIDLERDKEKIKKHFDPICGLLGETDSGAIVVFFDNAFYVPTGESDLKRIEIHLKIIEWKGV